LLATHGQGLPHVSVSLTASQRGERSEPSRASGCLLEMLGELLAVAICVTDPLSIDGLLKVKNIRASF